MSGINSSIGCSAKRKLGERASDLCLELDTNVLPGTAGGCHQHFRIHPLPRNEFSAVLGSQLFYHSCLSSYCSDRDLLQQICFLMSVSIILKWILIFNFLDSGSLKIGMLACYLKESRKGFILGLLLLALPGGSDHRNVHLGVQSDPLIWVETNKMSL